MIVFATNNAHKLQEIRQILGDGVRVMSLAEIGCHDDIPETADTLEGNAEIKARWVAEKYGADMVFADDTGLEVAALGGAPGVYSARYAGPGHDSAANMARLLREMDGVADRRARFRTVIALIRGGELTLVKGEVRGHIATMPSGTDGFGYDPVFVPEGGSHTFAEMSADAKNAISHRGRAMARLLEVLSSQK
ncbi:MAG: RdgB/HAM1 family non-canonical purine NTP pyrophosphatase [Muribaculaceae bacterium]|nr:RdgB/HAM1 family non-canonical purine NTP pyrophosphatase [Muribaculaceae bacterium]